MKIIFTLLAFTLSNAAFGNASDRPSLICDGLRGAKRNECVRSGALEMLANGETVKCLENGAGNGGGVKPNMICVGEKVFFLDRGNSGKCQSVTLSKLMSGNYRQERMGGYSLYRFKDASGELDWKDDTNGIFTDEAACKKYQSQRASLRVQPNARKAGEVYEGDEVKPATGGETSGE